MHNRLNSRRNFLNISGKLLIWIYAIIVLVPLYFIIITALKTPVEVTVAPLQLPEVPQWKNFITAIQEAGLIKALWNSIYTAVIGIGIQLFFVILLSYCCHRLRNHKIGSLLYMLILVGLFIPKVGYVTVIRLYRSLDIYNTPMALIVTNALSNISFSVFIVSGFLRTIPKELEEAAVLDGCNDWNLVTRVLMPVIKPALVTVGIFSFTTAWNSVTQPLLYVRDAEYRTVPMALLEFKGSFSTNYTLLFAGMLITSIPLVVVYLRCQKQFVQALAGSVKG